MDKAVIALQQVPDRLGNLGDGQDFIGMGNGHGVIADQRLDAEKGGLSMDSSLAIYYTLRLHLESLGAVTK
jgi:hypothetical protein